MLPTLRVSMDITFIRMAKRSVMALLLIAVKVVSLLHRVAASAQLSPRSRSPNYHTGHHRERILGAFT